MVVKTRVIVRALLLSVGLSGLSLEVDGARAGQSLYVGVPSAEPVQLGHILRTPPPDWFKNTLFVVQNGSVHILPLSQITMITAGSTRRWS